MGIFGLLRDFASMLPIVLYSNLFTSGLLQQLTKYYECSFSSVPFSKTSLQISLSWWLKIIKESKSKAGISLPLHLNIMGYFLLRIHDISTQFSQFHLYKMCI